MGYSKMESVLRSPSSEVLRRVSAAAHIVNDDWLIGQDIVKLGRHRRDRPRGDEIEGISDLRAL